MSEKLETISEEDICLKSKVKCFISGVMKALGIVFGDIGTSPIYTFTVIFLLTKPTEFNIVGILSLIIWTLLILVTAEYSWLAMSLSKKGEGGTIVLKELLVPLLKSSRQVVFITLFTFIAISLLIGDGVITPAISILSAVEGMLLIPGLEHTSQSILIGIAAVIAVILFAFQSKGTEKVSKAFGPIMLVWFIVLAASGLASAVHAPFLIKAINPYYAVHYLTQNGVAGFFVLSEVILCATGGEALYADMGHLGRVPIVRAWGFVFVALVLNYFGQGAFLLTHPHAKNILFEMIYSQAQVLYVPFLLLSIVATVIASQAMISGMFSVVYQGITTRIMPMFKVEYTSADLRSQIYINTVNWFLLFFVIVIMIIFKKSSNLAAAYGLAVTGTMTFTGIMMSMIFYLKKHYWKAMLAIFVTFVDLLFLVANCSKIPHGGYWSIIIALIPFVIILIYTQGQKRLYSLLRPTNIDKFLHTYNDLYANNAKIKGTALYFVRDFTKIPPYIYRLFYVHNIMYENNVLVSVNQIDEPFGINYYFLDDLSTGLKRFVANLGYMEVVDLEKIMKEADICEKAIFYGLEDITTGNIIWKIFAIIKRLTPTFVQFYRLPTSKLHGVTTSLEL